MAEKRSISSGFSWLFGDTLNVEEKNISEDDNEITQESDNNMKNSILNGSDKKSLNTVNPTGETFTDSTSVPVPEDTKESNDENSDTESSDTDEGEDSDIDEDLTDNRTKWRNKKNSQLFVISVDGVPRFYAKSRNKAEKKVHDIVHFIEYRHPDWDIYLERATDDLYHLVKTYKYFIVQYDQIYRRIRINAVHELEFYE